MKTLLIFKSTGLVALVIALFAFSSCSESSYEKVSDEQNKLKDNDSEILSIDDSDFTETDEDLTSVDYKEFYDQLSPHGEWLEISVDELGMNSKSTTHNNNPQSGGFSFSDVFSVKSALASYDLNSEMIFVWKPSVSLAVDAMVEEEPYEYVPYTNGQWFNTDAGWYFKAPTPAEEIVHHYGRWVNSAATGWVWVPGRVWAPAWVDWRENDEYVAWAPIPASAYIVDDRIKIPVINDDRYILVEKKDFLQPDLYKYIRIENKNKIIINEMTRTDGVMVKNKSVINKGPEVSAIEKHWGNKINIVKINRVKSKKDMKYSDDEFRVFTPVFNRVTNTENVRKTLSKPNTFMRSDEWSKKQSDGKELKNKEQKEIKSDNKNQRPDDTKGKSNNKGKKDDNPGKKSDDDKNKRSNDNKGKGNRNN